HGLMVFHDHFEVILPRSHDFAAVWRRVLVILLVLRLLSPGDMPTRCHGTQDQRESNDYPHPAWYAHDVSSPQSHENQTQPWVRQSHCADAYSSTTLTSSANASAEGRSAALPLCLACRNPWWQQRVFDWSAKRPVG